MTNSLIEKISRQLEPVTWTEIDKWIIHPEGSDLRLGAEAMRRACLDTAGRYIFATLDHFSDPANVTDKMSDAAGIEFERTDVPDTETYDTSIRRAIAAAMKATKEELK